MEDVLIEKARLLWTPCEEALEDMDILYKHKRYRACVGRAYYADVLRRVGVVGDPEYGILQAFRRYTHIV